MAKASGMDVFSSVWQMASAFLDTTFLIHRTMLESVDLVKDPWYAEPNVPPTAVPRKLDGAQLGENICKVDLTF